jgi:hypothetical protein
MIASEGPVRSPFRRGDIAEILPLREEKCGRLEREPKKLDEEIGLSRDDRHSPRF